MNPSPTSDCCQSLPPLHQYSRARQDIRTILEAELQLSHRVRESLDIIRETFEQFGVEHVALSFNGGKDCTVMLHLVAAVLAEQQHKHPESWAPIKTLYVTHHSPFGEVDDFVEFVATR
ncbi:uncharacterized protein BJ171DRAFT_580484 [Polychytrium aggregatum]|uniref:uncharacterized protein n=1 Tax=Polychytrium aggregatum TaxID=110093 RepID=UPI0022FEE66F|nr:uncharacterized protein BJ171DRAFT_580484 [Polychytrium aggregatum]KAI9205834.1 hypothetical protein BJ171DRAFT_580484 [Polychytrium aggregatum]